MVRCFEGTRASHVPPERKLPASLALGVSLMVFFARIRTAPKILAVVSIVAVVVAVVGVIGVRRIQGLSDTIGRLYQSEITALSSTKQAALNVLAIKEASARALVAEDSSEISFQRDVVATFDTEFVKALARAKPAVTDSAFAAKLTEAEHSYPAFLQGAHETINLAIARKHDAAVAKSTEVAAYGQAIADLLSEVSASREVLADAAFKDSRAQFVRSRSLLFALAGGGVLAALLLGFFVARVITRPLGETVRVLEAVAKGDLSQRLPVIGTDEVARMSAALNTAIDAQRLSLDTAERASQEAEESAAREREQARSLRERVEHLQVVMRAAADGDLTREVPIEGDDALAELASAFKHLITGLRGQIGTIGTDSALLTASSDEMAALSEELSSGAEETAAQARTVAEAARAVSVAINSLAAGATTVGRQLTAIEDSTAEASKVTQQASDLARGGSEMLAQLRTSSQKIGGVTEVIRNVAKQTNLLALNAAVEAARAGNAGLGFAVVAEEVRQLAGRTAEATTQISETVEGLQKDAAAATKTLAQITDVVSRVDALQRAVVAAVSEQAVTTGRMTASVNEVTTEAEKISVSIGDVAAGARTTSEGSAQLQSAAVQLTRLAGELDGFVKRFRIEDSASVGGRGGPAVPPSVRRVGRGTTSSPVPAF